MVCEQSFKGNLMSLNAIRPVGPHIEGFIRFASEGEGETLHQLNHFEVLSRVHQNSDGGAPKLTQHPIASKLGEITPNKEAGQINEIPVRLLFNSPENNLSAKYEAYDTDLNRLVCAGNGENFSRASLISGQTTTGPCPGPDLCAYANDGGVQCHLKVRLKVQIEGQGDPFSIFELQSGSINTYRTVSAKLQMMHAAFNGKLRHVPLTLTIWDKSSAESEYAPFYCADLKLEKEETMSSANKKAEQGALEDTNAGLTIDAMETAVKQMRTEGVLSLDGSEDAVITFTQNRIPGKAARRTMAAPVGDDISSVIALAKAAVNLAATPDSAVIRRPDAALESVAIALPQPALEQETLVPETIPSSDTETPPTPI